MPSAPIQRHLTFALLSLGLVLSACSNAGEEPAAPARTTRPNLLWISVDTLRADHLGCYGYFRETSPNIDRLADRSILFERCVVPMATTLPSHLSVLTGTYPPEHGVLANVTQGGKRFIPSPALQSVAELLSELDYDTAAFVSATPLRPWTGINAGFAEFNGPMKKERPGGMTTELALQWLTERQAKATDGGETRPFFLWVHLFDPHTPYKAPPEWQDRFQTDPELEAYLAEREFVDQARGPTGTIINTRSSHNSYDSEILYADSQVGLLLDAFENWGLAENTVIVFFSDHGEGLGQHGEPAHGLIWEEQLHAALLLHLPGVTPQRCSTRISSVDIFPTLFGQVDIPGIEPFLTQASGIDVLSPDFSPRPIWSQTSKRQRLFGQDARCAITAGPWKYSAPAEGPGTLYNLDQDPHELKNVADQHPDIVEHMSSQLGRMRSALEDRGAALEAGEEGALDPEILQGLKDLGYTSDE